MKYILVVVDYVSEWVETIELSYNEGKSFTTFFKNNIFSKHSHFCNKLFKALLGKYGVRHNVATPYHPPTNGQVEVSKREIKHIITKTVNANRMDWSKKCEDVLWAYPTSYNTPIEHAYVQLDRALLTQESVSKWSGRARKR
ncbi:uncharacterized protein LOC107027500 [Solanum pennellii]|uniref:Uncharacterized protein LOC107027500 n=1 Tax=Solanum pennellii TaxID=28526 RepID=A0ABM1HE17_SOLPN|nr:uncharacterized protein LOC107027500 [Solanum pennellii]